MPISFPSYAWSYALDYLKRRVLSLRFLFDFHFLIRAVFVFCVLRVVFKHEGKQTSKGMKTKLHYISWFLVFTDTKLLPACRACSTCCKLPHEGAMLWMQDAWNKTMWEVLMRCGWYCSHSMVWESVIIVLALFVLLCYSENTATNYLFRTYL